MHVLLTGYEFIPLSWIMLGATLIALIVSGLGWHWRTTRGARYLALMEAAIAIWTFSAALEMAGTTVAHKLFWSQVAYLGVTTAPVLFFVFAMSIAQLDRYLTPRALGLLFVMPAITIGMAVTNPWHGWLWSDIRLLGDPHITLFERGWWWWIFVVYVYSLLMIGVIAIYIAILQFPDYYKSQIGTIFLGSILPIVTNIMYILRVDPIPGLDLTPLAFLLSGPILGWSIFRYRLFDLVPVARNKLIDTIGDAILVIDSQGRIVDLNPAAQRLISQPAQRVIGRQAAQMLAHWSTLLEQLPEQDEGETEFELRLNEADKPRCFNVRLTSLRSRRRFTGWLVVLRDISRRKQMEEERERIIAELQTALTQVKTLRGMLPICANCKKIRDDGGYWHSVEEYVRDHSEADFSHGICPDCMHQLYGEYFPDKK